MTTATYLPTEGDTVHFNDGEGKELSGVVIRVWTKPNAPYVTVLTTEVRPRKFVRLVSVVRPAQQKFDGVVFSHMQANVRITPSVMGGFRVYVNGADWGVYYAQDIEEARRTITQAIAGR